MEEVKRAREALSMSILAAVQGFEAQFPGAYVEMIHVLHERSVTPSPVSEIRVEVRL